MSYNERTSPGKVNNLIKFFEHNGDECSSLSSRQKSNYNENKTEIQKTQTKSSEKTQKDISNYFNDDKTAGAIEIPERRDYSYKTSKVIEIHGKWDHIPYEDEIIVTDKTYDIKSSNINSGEKSILHHYIDHHEDKSSSEYFSVESGSVPDALTPFNTPADYTCGGVKKIEDCENVIHSITIQNATQFIEAEAVRCDTGETVVLSQNETDLNKNEINESENAIIDTNKERLQNEYLEKISFEGKAVYPVENDHEKTTKQNFYDDETYTDELETTEKELTEKEDKLDLLEHKDEDHAKNTTSNENSMTTISQFHETNILDHSGSNEKFANSNPHGIVILAKKIEQIATPTVYPAVYWDAEEDAKELHKAMKGLGTDEDTIIRVLCSRSLEQRLKIANVYELLYKKNLKVEIQKETSGDLYTILTALLMPLPDYLASELRKAMKGLGTCEDTLIEIICGYEEEISCIQRVYHDLFKAKLEDHINKETSGDLKKILVDILTRYAREYPNTSPATIAAQLAETDAKDRPLINIDTLGTLLVQYTKDFIQSVVSIFEESSNRSFSDLIKQVSKKDAQNALLMLLRSLSPHSILFAEEIEKCFKGLGTNESKLTRIIVSRCENDLENIKEEFARIYGKTLDVAIKKETSGHYLKTLTALIKGCNQDQI